ncbi:MAG TPA: mechanosensitive ion channel domain-containing protein [Gemmatimonadaceae bacterium]|nr:mechanosensitive ion channel domain-containing protein [Gemmatimonadaceae bacterium]
MTALAISSGTTTQKILATLALFVGVIIIAGLLRAALSAALARKGADKPRFWGRQVIGLLALAAIVAGIGLIWGPSLKNASGIFGLVAAGVAVALQRVITSFAGYLIILRGNVFTVGDRITIGGVRGDVVALGFMQTTVLEMGESPPEQAAEPAIWVRGRQYTGRVVRITNDKIFDSPVYNYTREFPYVWDEIMIPIHHNADRKRAEEILLSVAGARTRDVISEATPCIDQLRRRYFVKGDIDLEPKVFMTITDNWLELALRFTSREPGVRALKDALYRDILEQFAGAGISIASSTSEVSIVTPLEVSTAAAK